MRPAVHAMFLSDLASRIQRTQRHIIRDPALLAADPATAIALVSTQGGKFLHVYDYQRGKVLHDLPLPKETRLAADFCQFRFDPDYRLVGGYNRRNKVFAVWSLDDGSMLIEHHGEGMIDPVIGFLPSGQIILCDGQSFSVYQEAGHQLYFGTIPDGVQSLVIYPSRKNKNIIIGVGAFRIGKSGVTIKCLHFQNGIVQDVDEGPYRPRPEAAIQEHRVCLQEMVRIPGMTDEIVVFLEEECMIFEPDDRHHLNDYFKTRLISLHPHTSKFYEEEIGLEGRFCLQPFGKELHLVDELGRHRLVEGPPLRLKEIDWRLEH